MKYLVTRKPVGSLSSLNDFDRIFSNFWNDLSTVPSVRAPRVDIKERKDSYLLEAELPGLSEKDVDVQVEKHILTISAKTEEEKKDEQENYLIQERRSSSFRRSFKLPEGVAEENIHAEFKHGILTLTIPKLPEKQPKKIEVKVA